MVYVIGLPWIAGVFALSAYPAEVSVITDGLGSLLVAALVVSADPPPLLFFLAGWAASARGSDPAFDAGFVHAALLVTE